MMNFGYPLYWRHNDHGGCFKSPASQLFTQSFIQAQMTEKKTKLRVTGLCARNSPGPVNSPHKGPVTRKKFPFDDVIMSWYYLWCRDALIHVDWTASSLLVPTLWPLIDAKADAVGYRTVSLLLAVNLLMAITLCAAMSSILHWHSGLWQAVGWSRSFPWLIAIEWSCRANAAAPGYSPSRAWEHGTLPPQFCDRTGGGLAWPRTVTAIDYCAICTSRLWTSWQRRGISVTNEDTWWY